jgi:hypothetical protein
MRPGALPVPQLILLDLVAPPILTGIWWMMARGWAGAIRGGSASARTKERQAQEFWVLLAVCYALAFWDHNLRMVDVGVVVIGPK